MFKRFIVLSLIFTASSWSFSTVAVESDVINMMSVKQRLERVERMVGSNVVMDQLQQIEALQEEISTLREQIDQQGYELSTLKQRQRSLYLDMDRRINVVETATPGSRSSAPVPPPRAATVPMHPSNNPVVVSSSPPTKGKKGKAKYNKAYNLLKEGRYKQSIVAFEGFLKSFPNSSYADNAQYWLGEANYANRQYKAALSEFQSLIAKYPESPKTQGARLKVAYVYYELKNWSAAQESLQQIIKLYPDTRLAKKANTRLERIKREGH